MLNKAGIKAEINKSFDSVKAEKMLINCSVSTLSVIKDKTIAGLLSDSNDRETVIKLIDETYSILSVKYKMRPLDQLREITLKLLERNGSHFPSLYQDYKRGERTELDYFNGQIIRWAKELNIAVPTSEEIYQEAKQIINSSNVRV
jgi:2-dehydropantoate 2-reductase